MHPPGPGDAKVVDPQFVWPAVLDSYDFIMNDDNEWILSDIIYFRGHHNLTNLPPDFAVIRDKSNQYSIDLTPTFALVVIWAVHRSHTIGEHQELLECVDGLLADVRMSEGQFQALEGQEAAHLAQSDSVRSEVTQLKAAIEVV